MTFEDEDIRHAFHLLPTEKQEFYSRLQDEANKYGKVLHVLDVKGSEVLIRID